MDKYEYKLKINQIRALEEAGDYEQAAEIADGINWRKVKNANTLTFVGDIYEKAGRYEESIEVLLLAYDRAPIGRKIVYKLAMVSIEAGNLSEAEEYYNEFVEIAPQDTQRYILLYRLSQAKGAPYEEQIAILEEFKEVDYSEEWTYELAYLYHKAVMVEKCIQTCDELVLWYGDGIYVEKALELKMLYQPLNRHQEEKYRQMKQNRSGVVEVRPNDVLESGEIVNEPVQIQPVGMNTGRFNTLNLQAELAKSMQQILDATEKETVTSTMDSVKKMVEEIPYLQLSREEEAQQMEQMSSIETDEEIDGSLNINFREILQEDLDGQMRINVPDNVQWERQITGQMCIDDILDEWEKTKRAAEAAMENARQRKLASAKRRALQETGNLMEKLHDIPAAPVLEEDFYKTAHEVLEEEMQNLNEAAEKIDDLLSRPENKLPDPTVELPDMDAFTMNEAKKELDKQKEEADTLAGALKAFQAAAPRKVTRQATKEFPGIPFLSVKPQKSSGSKRKMEAFKENAFAEDDVAKGRKAEAIREGELTEDDFAEGRKIDDKKAELPEEDLFAGSEEELPEEDLFARSGEELPEEDLFAGSEEELPEEDLFTGSEEELPEEDLFTGSEEELPEEDLFAGSGEGLPEEDLFAGEVEVELTEDDFIGGSIEEETDELPVIEEPFLEEEELLLEDAVEIDMPEIKEPEEDDLYGQSELTEEQKQIFSYFAQVGGMEQQICQVLTGAAKRLVKAKTSVSGNIIIQGFPGSGKTRMASNLLTALQQKTGRMLGTPGRIYADLLNKKELSVIINKVKGGCLIIEKAGELSKHTAQKLSLLMEQDTGGLLVILEDTRIGIEHALALDFSFAKKFTEKISIPIFTSDELVIFAKEYAKEQECKIDEMGVLALYQRIGNIQRADRATTLAEVKDIIDDAIESAERGSIKRSLGNFFSKRKSYDDATILMEEDFEI